MGGIELSEGTLHDYQDIAALQTESWRSAYRGILPVSYLDGPILEERETHWKNLMLPLAGSVAAFSLRRIAVLFSVLLAFCWTKSRPGAPA